MTVSSERSHNDSPTTLVFTSPSLLAISWLRLLILSDDVMDVNSSKIVAGIGSFIVVEECRSKDTELEASAAIAERLQV